MPLSPSATPIRVYEKVPPGARKTPAQIRLERGSLTLLLLLLFIEVTALSVEGVRAQIESMDFIGLDQHLLIILRVSPQDGPYRNRSPVPFRCHFTEAYPHDPPRVHCLSSPVHLL